MTIYIKRKAKKEEMKANLQPQNTTAWDRI